MIQCGFSQPIIHITIKTHTFVLNHFILTHLSEVPFLHQKNIQTGECSPPKGRILIKSVEQCLIMKRSETNVRVYVLIMARHKENTFYEYIL